MMYGLSKLSFIKSVFTNASIALVICVIAFATTYSQSDTATLSGIVYDEQKSPIADASITITKIDTSTKRTVITNNQGIYVFVSLSAGAYELTVERSGFAPRNYKGIVLNVGGRNKLDIELKVKGIEDVFNVEINEAGIIQDDAAVRTVIDRNFVGNLPLNGRSFISLIATTPGVVLTSSSPSEAGQFSVNGQRASSNYFTIDGAGANAGASPAFNIGQSAGGALPGLGALGSTSNLISIEALQEFTVLTSTYAPEYGRTPGAQVLMITRNGNNTLTGSLYNYFRNDVLDANNWFANANGSKRAAMRHNNFGGVLGGPIIKDKTFYFFSYEGVRLRQPKFDITSVPSLSLRDDTSISNELKQFLNSYPKPNRPPIGNGAAQFLSSYSNPSTMDSTSIRIDQNLSDNISLFGRYNYSPSNTKLRGASDTSLNTISSILSNTSTLTIGANITHSPRILSELRFNYTKADTLYDVLIDDFGNAIPASDSVLFISPYTKDNSQMIFVVGGGNHASLFKGIVTKNIQKQINIIGHLSYNEANHQLKFGIDYRRLSPFNGVKELEQLVFFSGFAGASDTSTFGSVKSGLPFIGMLTASDPNTLFISNWSTYAQDTWRFSPKLTLTYGLRWEINPAPVGEKPLTAAKNVDSPSTLALDFSGTPVYQTKYGNIAPRLGISYLLSGKQRRETVIRGGFGIFYDLGTGSIGALLRSYPYSRVSNVPALNKFPFQPGIAVPPPFTLNPPYTNTNIFDPNLPTPKTYQWNFTIEQLLGVNHVIRSSYIGAIGRKLLRMDQQSLIGNTLFRSNAVAQTTRGIATSDYHALQLQYQSRLNKGLQSTLSYSFAKSLDNISNDSSFNLPLVVTDKSLDRGYSDFDVRHSMSAAVTYQFPLLVNYPLFKQIFQDWTIDSIVTIRSSTPFNITYPKTLPGIGRGRARPDLVPGIPLFITDPQSPTGARLNKAAFLQTTEMRQGTLGRNVLRGSSAWQINLGLKRQFNLTERVGLIFGAQAFNLFNHPNFSNPIGALDSPDFGSVKMLSDVLSVGLGGGLNSLYQFGGPRSMQLYLKVNF